MKRLIRVVGEIVYGIHSEIPLCCIWAFIRGKWALDIRNPGWSGGYVPCDRCEYRPAKKIHVGGACCDRIKRFIMKYGDDDRKYTAQWRAK